MTQPANKRLLTEDQAAPLSSAAPSAPSSTASSGASVTVARSDHMHPAAGLYGWYGDGSDGDMVLDGTNTYTAPFTKSGNIYTCNRPVYANDLVVGAGVTVRLGGQILYVLGTLSGAGTLLAEPGVGSYVMRYTVLGAGGIGPAGGAGAGANGTAPAAVEGVPGTSGNGGSGSGGAGGFGQTNNSTYTAQSLMAWQTRNPVSAFSGLFTYMDFAAPTNNPNSYFWRGGPSGGAGGGGGGNGGKGGDGGGICIVNARRITGTFVVWAKGENGGNAVGTNAGGGGGGTGGLVVLNTTNTTGWTGSLSAAAGAGGTKNGTGVAGAAGAAGITRLNVWA